MNRFIPIIISILIFFFWEIIIFLPKNFLSIFVLIICVFFGLLFKLNKFKIKNKDFWMMSISPFFFTLFFTVFLLFLNRVFLQHALAVVAALFLWMQLKHFYNFFFQITLYRPLALESFSAYLNTAAFLYFSISVYGLINFLNLQVYYLALLLVAVSFILTYQFFWINKIDEQNNLFASILTSILTVEIFWSMSFFPISHFVVGLALTIVYYVITNMTLLHFLNKLDKRLVKIYILIGVSCLLTILLSAKWL